MAGWTKGLFPISRSIGPDCPIPAPCSHLDLCATRLFLPSSQFPTGYPLPRPLPLLPALYGSPAPLGENLSSSTWGLMPTVVSSLPFSAFTTSLYTETT